ncbi:glycosyltransferase family 2 protein [Jannaschia pohangensis]|uniref:Methyltransferase domain-containing protein n=1 Tax=Jannaschia pohangensis TaxID=390807 RepID=A0A1I3T7I6_9RHOB|nr:glycosyltransferase family 2 protein [Jannaschia pohangensis]SFJ67098.1 Methyltransferase domain-containing protein [Jannaschia pohangensis]
MTILRDNARSTMDLLPKGGSGAEVGTNKGRWTRWLAEVAVPTSLTLIDPWAEDEAQDSRPHAFVAPQEERDADHDAIRAAYPEATILRSGSTDALTMMPDATLDWIWLDGNKQYDVILADLEQAARVVRPGGVIAGGGWHWGVELGRPVREAVSDLAARIDGAEVAQQGQFWSLQLPESVSLRPRPTEERFLIISTMKNEAPYILEWVAHNRAIGFTDFLVFTNDCDDTTDALLDRLEARGILTHQVNTVLKRGPHKSALRWAKDHVLRHKATWILITDVDEFINVRSADGTIQGLLADLGPETDVVSFPWKCFGNGGIEPFRDKPLTAQFTVCEPVPRRGGRKSRDVKTLFRNPDAMYHFGLHRPRVKDEWKDRIVWKSPSGEDISARMNKGQSWLMKWDGCQETAYMHHYPLRSLEAYILKKNRGRANHVGEDLGLDYWDKWNMTGGRDKTLVDGAPGFAEALADLRSDRATRQLHKQGVAWHRAQFAELMEDARYRDLWDELKTRKTAKSDA